MFTCLVDDVALHFTSILLRYFTWTRYYNTIRWTASPSSCLMTTRASTIGSSWPRRPCAHLTEHSPPALSFTFVVHRVHSALPPELIDFPRLRFRTLRARPCRHAVCPSQPCSSFCSSRTCSKIVIRAHIVIMETKNKKICSVSSSVRGLRGGRIVENNCRLRCATMEATQFGQPLYFCLMRKAPKLRKY